MTYKLDDYADVINGGAWSENEYVPSGLKVVKVTNMVNGTISDTPMSYLPISANDIYCNHKLHAGDLVIATVGSHPDQPNSVVGKTATIPSEFDGAFLNQNAACIRVKDINKVNPRFLTYLSRTTPFKYHVESRARGSANQVRLAISELKKFTYVFPSVTIQRKIAAILSAYDDLIQNNSRKILIMEKTAESLYREWFVRLRFPGHEKNRIVKGVPDGWMVKKLENLAHLVKEKFIAQEHSNLPLVDLEKMAQKTLAVTEIGHSDELTTSRIIFRENDVLFSSIRPYLYKVNMAPFAGVTNTSIMVIRPLNEQFRSYITVLLFLKDSIAWANQYSTGTKMPVISWDVFKRMQIFEPLPSLLSRFESIASVFLNSINFYAQANLRLHNSRDRLLLRLMSGKIEVEDMDIELPASMKEEAVVA